MNNYKAAIQYCKNGWKVFPLWPLNDAGGCSCGKTECSKGGKHPHISGWEQQPCDSASVEKWWQQWPDAGIALRLDGLIVIDLDMHDGSNGFESVAGLEQEHGATLEALLKQRSGGGGEHQVFQGVEGIGKSIGFRSGLDLLTGPGCFIVVAPSAHASGSAYRWCDDANPLTTPRAELALSVVPDWLLLAAAKPKKSAKSTAKAKAKPAADRVPVERIMNAAVDKVKGGAGRNDAGFWFYQQLNDNQYSKDEAFLTLRAWIDAANAAAPSAHRYTMEEARATWRSAYTKEARDPWAESDKGPSHADILLGLIGDFEYFKSGSGNEAYVRMEIGGHREVWRVSDRDPKVLRSPDPSLPGGARPRT